jgi:hypothetical protein
MKVVLQVMEKLDEKLVRECNSWLKDTRQEHYIH